MKSAVCFLLPASPVLYRSIIHIGSTPAYGDIWFRGVKWVAGYTCFPSTWHPALFLQAGLFLIVFVICLRHLGNKNAKRMVGMLVIGVAFMCAAGTVFADIYPVPFIIKLSLWRSTVIYLFLALPVIGIILGRLCTQSPSRRIFVFCFVVLLTGYCEFFPYYYLAVFIPLLVYLLHEKHLTRRIPVLKNKFPVILCACILPALLVHATCSGGSFRMILFGVFAVLFFAILYLFKGCRLYTKPAVYGMIFFLILDAGILYDIGGPRIYYHGYFQGRQDPWADIQLFARTHSRKDELFIVPPYMNGFTLYSLRAVLGDWAEGSTMLYLDNQFASEWFERMHALGWTQYNLIKKGYNSLTTDRIIDAAAQYGARYIVTEKPKQFVLPKVYENSKFILYEVSLSDRARDSKK